MRLMKHEIIGGPYISTSTSFPSFSQQIILDMNPNLPDHRMKYGRVHFGLSPDVSFSVTFPISILGDLCKALDELTT
jgi:hypothetical protein